MDETVVSQRIIHKLDEEPDFDATDLKSETTDAPVHYKREIVWRNIFAMLMLHVGAVYGYWALAMDPGYPWYTALVPDTIGRLGALGVLCGSHRLWSHRAFKAKLPLRIFLMLMHTLSLQNDIYDWCRDHRLHHKFSDTDADPYNARRGFFFSHMGWLLVRKHPEVIRKGLCLLIYSISEQILMSLLTTDCKLLPLMLNKLISNRKSIVRKNP